METFTPKKFPRVIFFLVLPRIMDNQEKEILHKAVEMFNSYGLRTVTMDEIASETNVSKKTLYKYFNNKEELVQHAVDLIISENHSKLDHIIKDGGNAIDDLFDIDRMVCENIESHNHNLQFQLKKYYPSTFQYVENIRRQLMTEAMLSNITKGQKEGLYRGDINAEIIALLYYGRMTLLMSNDCVFFANYKVRDIMRETLIYHIAGVASKEGNAYLNEKLNHIVKQ